MSAAAASHRQDVKNAKNAKIPFFSVFNPLATLAYLAVKKRHVFSGYFQN